MDSIFRMRQNLIKRRKRPTRTTVRKRKGIAFLPALMMGLGGLNVFSKLGSSLVNRKSGRKKTVRKKRFDIRKNRFNIRKSRFNIRKGDLDTDFLAEFGGLDEDVITKPTQSYARMALNNIKKLFKNKNIQKYGKQTGKAVLSKIKNQLTKKPTPNKINKQIADAVITREFLGDRYSGRRRKRVY